MLERRDHIFIYGFPAVRDADGRWVVKTAFHFAPNLTRQDAAAAGDCDPDTVDRAVTDAEVKAANRRALLAFRERFHGLFERIAALHPPREPVDPAEMADLVNSVIEGAIILARGMGDPPLLTRQVLLARQLIKSLYRG